MTWGRFQRFGFDRSLIMALVDKRDGRNFGYGRQLSYTGPQALHDLFGGGYYGTVKTHSDRCRAFVRWCRSDDGPGFNDPRQILLDYAGHLRQQVEQGAIGVATAQKRLSSVNRTMAAILGDLHVKVSSPSKALGMRRTSLRHSVPQAKTANTYRRRPLRISAAARRRHRPVGTSHRHALARGDFCRPPAPQA